MVNRYLILWGSCLGREQKGNILQMYTVDCTDCMLVYHVMLRSHLLWGSSSFLQSQSHVHFLTASSNSNHAAGVRGPCQLRQILIKLSSWSQLLHCQDKSSLAFLQHFPTQSPKPMASEAMPNHAGLRMPFRSLVLAHAALVGTEGRSLPGGIKPSNKGLRFCCWKRNPHDCCFQNICRIKLDMFLQLGNWREVSTSSWFPAIIPNCKGHKAWQATGSNLRYHSVWSGMDGGLPRSNISRLIINIDMGKI